MNTRAPLGPISIAIDALRSLLAQSKQWQAWTGSPSVSEALEHTHHTILPRPKDGRTYSRAESEALRPFAFVDIARDGGGGFRTNRSAEAAYADFGTLLIDVEADVPSELANREQAAEAERDFLNRLGLVIEDIKDLSRNDNLIVRSLEIVTGPHRAAMEEEAASGDYHFVQMRVVWGP